MAAFKFLNSKLILHKNIPIEIEIASYVLLEYLCPWHGILSFLIKLNVVCNNVINILPISSLA